VWFSALATLQSPIRLGTGHQLPHQFQSAADLIPPAALVRLPVVVLLQNKRSLVDRFFCDGAPISRRLLEHLENQSARRSLHPNSDYRSGKIRRNLFNTNNLR